MDRDRSTDGMRVCEEYVIAARSRQLGAVEEGSQPHLGGKGHRCWIRVTSWILNGDYRYEAEPQDEAVGLTELGRAA